MLRVVLKYGFEQQTVFDEKIAKSIERGPT